MTYKRQKEEMLLGYDPDAKVPLDKEAERNKHSDVFICHNASAHVCHLYMIDYT